MDFLRHHLVTLTEAAILMFEFVGVVVLIITGILGIYNYIRHSPHTRLNLAKGLALGLEFKMGGEILRTVIVHEFSEILVVGGIIILRAALAFLIHWGIKNEEAEAPKDELNHDEPIVTIEPVEC
ncbi:DUF1622 domain-containing protein [Anaerotignum sp.]|uniref:DUF1622 domain-containing protein n=1 Tax=Anaerotignum sp. TaxID=2039241 RepID=UPI00331F86B8